MADRRTITPFALSMVSLGLIGSVGFIALQLLPTRTSPESPAAPAAPAQENPAPAPLTEEERESLVAELETRLRRTALSWKHRAASSGVAFLAESWKGTPWLAPPPPGAAAEIRDMRLREWSGEKPAEADRAEAHRVLREFFRSIRAVTYGTFKVAALERTREGIAATIQFELQAVTDSGGVIERRGRHETVWSGGRVVRSRRVWGRELTSPRPWFAEFARTAGLRVPILPETEESLPLSPLLDPYAFLAGVAVGDYDGDGLHDIYVPRLGKNLLYRNRGDGTFEDVTDRAGVGHMGEGASALFLDHDGDGELDLLVANHSPAQVDRGDALVLYHNRGDGTFEDVTAAIGLTTRGPATSLCAADVDLDGDLDVYVCMYEDLEKSDPDVPVPVPDRFLAAGNGVVNQLWINDGGRFREAARDAGVADTGWSFAAAFADYDDDGAPDLYVANDWGENTLYRNRGDGTFEAAPHAKDPGFGMGVSWSDVDGDGKLDLYVSNMYSTAGSRIIDSGDLPPDLRAALKKASRGNSLFLNRDGFADATEQAGVANAGWAWGSAFFDADHDGREDLYVMSGYFTGESEADL